jgi:integrase/recombinase XerC
MKGLIEMTTALVEVNGTQIETRKIFGASLIERFAKFAGVSESSRQTYTKCLRQLFRYFADNSIEIPTRDNLVDWLEIMKSEGKSPSTVQLYLTAAKIFFRWLSQEGIFANIADHLKSGVKPSHNHKKDALSTEQCKELIKNVLGEDLKSLRDRAILSLMTTAGLRTIEIVRANVGDVRFERGKVFLYVQGKGRSAADEKVLLSKQTYSAIKIYLKARGKVQSSAPLFVSTSRRNKNFRLETQTISRMVKKNLRGIGLDSPRLSAHSLRHSTATNLIFAGIELPKVQMILRHKSLNTTMIYAAAWERYCNDGEQILADVIFKE